MVKEPFPKILGTGYNGGTYSNDLDLDLNTGSYVIVGGTEDSSIHHLQDSGLYAIIMYFEGTLNSMKWSKILTSDSIFY